MDFTIPPSIFYLASWLGLIGGVWALFDRAETVITPEARSVISRWLKGLNHEQTTWPSSFANVFDKIFGVRHASFGCFIRSSIASMFATLIIFLIWAASYPSAFLGVAFDKSNLTWILGLFILNIIPDYLSLLETRWILKLLQQVQSARRAFALLLADLFLTALLGLTLFLLFVVARHFSEFLRGQMLFWLNVTRGGTHLEGMAERSVVPSYLIWFFSTFLTSIWIYLYLSGRLLAVVLSSFGKTITSLLPVFDIDAQPLRFIGFTSMLVISVIYLLMAIIR